MHALWTAETSVGIAVIDPRQWDYESIVTEDIEFPKGVTAID